MTPQLRRNAKAVNFGIIYGISSFGLSQDLSISKAEAAEYIERYFETYPQVKAFVDRLVADAKKDGYAITMYGGDVRSRNLNPTCSCSVRSGNGWP